MNWRVRWDDILFGNPAKNHQLDNRVSSTPHWAVLVTDHGGGGGGENREGRGRDGGWGGAGREGGGERRRTKG